MVCTSKLFDLSKTFSIVQKIFEAYIPSGYDRKYKDLSKKSLLALVILSGGLSDQSKNDEILIYHAVGK